MKTPQKIKPGLTLAQMIQIKPLEQLLADHDIFDTEGAAQRSGYTPQHVRRLCREDRIPHETRGDNPDEVQYFLTPEQLSGLFQSHKARA